MMKKTLYGFLIFLALTVVFVLVLSFHRPAGTTDKIEWGAAFSKYFAQEIGLDWRETYLAILNDLKPKSLRLAIYWPDIEPQSETYVFDDYDWMLSQAKEKNVKLILVIGRKVPRWPECHVPDWARSLNEKSQQDRVLKMLPQIINRFKNYNNLDAWQVENEPFLAFGECPAISADFLDEEINLVRSLDAKHPIITTDSGELSIWLRAAKRGDIFGTTMYRVIWNQFLGYYKYPLPPNFFWLKANLVRIFNPAKPIIVSELQGEPWTHKRPPETPLEEQLKSMNFDQFKENIAYARQVGFSPVYLWGAEWWYWMKTKQGHPEFWEEAKNIIKDK